MDNEEKILTILGQVQTNMEKMQISIDKMQTDITRLEQGQAELKQEVALNSTHLMRIELDHGEKLAAIADALSVNHDAVTSDLQPRVGKLEQVTEKHTIEISFLKAVK